MGCGFGGVRGGLIACEFIPVSAPAEVKRPRLDWATLHARTWGIDVWKCRCGGKRKVLAGVASPPTPAEKLRDLGLLPLPPPPAPAQPPPPKPLARSAAP